MQSVEKEIDKNEKYNNTHKFKNLNGVTNLKVGLKIKTFYVKMLKKEPAV